MQLGEHCSVELGAGIAHGSGRVGEEGASGVQENGGKGEERNPVPADGAAKGVEGNLGSLQLAQEHGPSLGLQALHRAQAEYEPHVEDDDVLRPGRRGQGAHPHGSNVRAAAQAAAQRLHHEG